MTTMRDTAMPDRAVNVLFILCLIAAVGIMSWRSMHPPIATSRGTTIFYYAGNGITPDKIPADDNPITVGVGAFGIAANGKPTWTPAGMPPATIAQRQINLQFRFSNLPRHPAAAVSRIESVVKDWVHKGDMVNVLVFDYSPAQPDIAAYAALIRAARAHFTKEYTINPYSIYPTANLLWAEKAQDLPLKGAPVMIRVPDAHLSPQSFARLSALKKPFMLQFPKGVGSADIDLPRLLKLKELKGVTLTLDPDRPLPRKTDAVGLFPKF